MAVVSASLFLKKQKELFERETSRSENIENYVKTCESKKRREMLIRNARAN